MKYSRERNDQFYQCRGLCLQALVGVMREERDGRSIQRGERAMYVPLPRLAEVLGPNGPHHGRARARPIERVIMSTAI